MKAIALKDVCKRYGRGPRILESLDLEVQAGEFLAVVGPSGCGKTTLLNLIGGLDQPESGRVTVVGENLGVLGDRALSRFRNTAVGFVFQTYHLHPRLNAGENVMLPALVAGWPTGQARRAAADTLHSLGLGAFLDKLPRTLSGGQMQRVAIARALVMAPGILLADEPTGNLDENTGRDILELVAQLNGEKHLTVLLVTHEPAIRSFASRVLTMADGRLKPQPEEG